MQNYLSERLEGKIVNKYSSNKILKSIEKVMFLQDCIELPINVNYSDKNVDL
jgi:hypothetical protein